MKIIKSSSFCFLLFILSLTTTLTSTPTHAKDGMQRLTLGGGVISMQHTNDTHFLLMGEYEHRGNPFLGLGTTVDYILSTPKQFLLAIPELFWHPSGMNWYINGAPVFYFVSEQRARAGVRLGTRVPIQIGLLLFVPKIAVDFIEGERNIALGLGLEF